MTEHINEGVSFNGKRQILVVDDEWVNREILGNILKDEYNVIFASNGEEALEQIRKNRRILSLVLLDLIMPVKSGLEVLSEMKSDPDIKGIPVIVITSDQESEVDSLTMGAVDFIPKPYPQEKIILARVLRTIELFEDRQTIESTEKDTLTGLYNKEYFFRYAEQFDLHCGDLKMDATVIDLTHFRIINERFGFVEGDRVLKMVGAKLSEIAEKVGGIVGRREADTFLIYCPHIEDHDAVFGQALAKMLEDEAVGNRVRVRMGVYEKVDKSLEMERRFDRAQVAADSIRGSMTKRIVVYDETMYKKELFEEQLIEAFPRAIEEKQFEVYFQPKFNVKGDKPRLASAEALVRWNHPELGMISPGVFIPLFENNGLIYRMDRFVWEESAKQISEWKRKFNRTVPVSVNVSRIDMYDPHLVDYFAELIEKNGLKTEDLMIEITESAYSRDSEQIIKTVNSIRDLGFRVEMDDFGTGYSSLNMISILPIDVLKLDMLFIRNAFEKKKKDTKIIEIIIDIANYLSVPVVAEGVETEEQMNALRDMGCFIIQGYYFSKPVCARDFEKFVTAEAENAAGQACELVR